MHDELLTGVLLAPLGPADLDFREHQRGLGLGQAFLGAAVLLVQAEDRAGLVGERGRERGGLGLLVGDLVGGGVRGRNGKAEDEEQGSCRDADPVSGQYGQVTDATGSDLPESCFCQCRQVFRRVRRHRQR